MDHVGRRFVLGAAVAALVALSCGGTTSGPAATQQPKGKVVVAAFNFTESSILARIYAKALEDKGYTIELKDNLGSREIVEPALEKGDIDLVPEYISTLLLFLNKGKADEASGDTQKTLATLRGYLEPKGLKALDPAPAQDHSAFVVSEETARKHNLKKMSDLIPIAGQLTLGASPQCPQRPACIPGLKRVYGLEFKTFKPLDPVGPLTRAALERGDIDVALLLSTDGAIAAKRWVPLDDDRHLQNAENVTPVIRASVLNDEIAQTLNAIAKELTTEDLITMNKAAQLDKEDPEPIAVRWLRDHKLLKK